MDAIFNVRKLEFSALSEFIPIKGNTAKLMELCKDRDWCKISMKQ